MLALQRLCVLVLIALWLDTGLSADQAGGPIQSSARREVLRLTSPIERPAVGTELTGTSRVLQSDDWQTVRRLATSARVVVITRANEDLAGRVADADECALRLRTRDGASVVIRRENVREIRLDARFGGSAAFGLGALFGGLAGLAIGHAKECDCELRGLGKALGAISGSIVGAVVGLQLGRALDDRPQRVVYAAYGPARSGGYAGCPAIIQ